MKETEQIKLLASDNEALSNELEEVRSDIQDILKLFCIYESLSESEISSLERENKNLKIKLGKAKGRNK
jgi:hypothetical protein